MMDLTVAAIQSSSSAPAAEVPIVVASRGGLDAALVTVGSGRLYDRAADDADEPAVILGRSAAESLGIVDIPAGRVVLVDGQRVILAGILDGHGSEPQLDWAAIVSPSAATLLGFALPAELTALVRTEPGAATSVALTLPLALRPDQPTAVGVALPPEPVSLREGVQGSLDLMGLGLAGLSLVMGGLGITNAMVSAVSQRRGEIGLRRSLGARPRDILTLVIAEGALLGLLGATLGTVIGLSALLLFHLITPWTPVLAAWVWPAAPTIGLVLGAIAGIHPARTSARLSPASALRQ